MKQENYLIWSDALDGFVIAGDIDQLMRWIKAEITADGLADGEARSFEFDIKRQDMTEAEIEAAPVV